LVKIDSDAATACAEELYLAFKIEPQSGWNAPRQADHYRAIISRHKLPPRDVPHAVGLALSRRLGAPVEL
jgi:hypothetical protein